MHLTGDKVRKPGDIKNLKVLDMAQLEEIKFEEKLLIAEINDMVSISELLHEYEVDSYKEALKTYRKKIREIHIRLQVELGEDQHKALFPEIENYLDRLKRMEIEASKKKRSLIESKEQKTRIYESENCMKVLLLEVSEFCKGNLEDMCNLGVNEKIMRAESYIENLDKTRVECESALGSVTYETLYAEKCENVLDELRKYLPKCKMFRKGLEEEIKEKRKSIVKQTEDENDKEIDI